MASTDATIRIDATASTGVQCNSIRVVTTRPASQRGNARSPNKTAFDYLSEPRLVHGVSTAIRISQARVNSAREARCEGKPTPLGSALQYVYGIQKRPIDDSSVYANVLAAPMRAL